ncbi:DUF551 domain-containing protein [Klebsiella michiganensis]|uniref:DUF551 domain-containing protein n=1 Tax=Klebsiella michiganensis TaxID=1134687 RepID=UPI0021806920|nr:DUF551 domain-containing protein [Klebsiella michiganensis]
MTKSTITRERLKEIVSDPMVNQGSEFAMMARMALAALDSEPVRSPVLAYADSYRDMAKQGVESVPIWSVITDLERNIAPLYIHAQQPVAYSDFEEFWSAYIHPLAQDDELKGFAWDIWSVLGSNSQPAPVVPEEVTAEDCPALVKYDVTEVDEAWARGFNSCRAAMLQAYPVCTCPSGDGSLRRPCPVHPGNSPVIPDGWTGNDKANAALMMLDRIETADPVDDDRIDGIKRIVSELVAATHDTPALNSVQSVVTVPGKWIPVSERMPENDESKPIAIFTGKCLGQGIFVATYDDNGFFDFWEGMEIFGVTHWMPLPAAPQEVKGE